MAHRVRAAASSGFHYKKIELLRSRSGAQLFAGTADGSLMVYERRPDADADADGGRPRGFACAVTEALRRCSRRPEGGRADGRDRGVGVLVAVVDGGALAAYDLATLRALAPPSTAEPSGRGAALCAHAPAASSA